MTMQMVLNQFLQYAAIRCKNLFPSRRKHVLAIVNFLFFSFLLFHNPFLFLAMSRKLYNMPSSTRKNFERTEYGYVRFLVTSFADTIYGGYKHSRVKWFFFKFRLHDNAMYADASRLPTCRGSQIIRRSGGMTH